jgi:hypothetical protein
LILQESPKHPGLVRWFLQGHQVLNLTEGHHPLDPILWDPASILEDSKLLGALGVPSILFTFFTLETKGMGWRFLCKEGGKAAADLENLLMGIFWIKILQQKRDHSALC